MRTDIYNNKIEQRSLQWYRARLGNFTGSSIHKLISKKNELTKTALSYIFEVAAERCLASKIVNGDEEFTEYLETVSVTTKAIVATATPPTEIPLMRLMTLVDFFEKR
jgi:hypothetical protein